MGEGVVVTSGVKGGSVSVSVSLLEVEEAMTGVVRMTMVVSPPEEGSRVVVPGIGPSVVDVTMSGTVVTTTIVSLLSSTSVVVPGAGPSVKIVGNFPGVVVTITIGGSPDCAGMVEVPGTGPSVKTVGICPGVVVTTTTGGCPGIPRMVEVPGSGPSVNKVSVSPGPSVMMTVV